MSSLTSKQTAEKRKKKFLEILLSSTSSDNIPKQDLLIDSILGIDTFFLEKNINNQKKIDKPKENYLNEFINPQALYTSWFDFYQIKNHLPTNITFCDLGAGIGRSKILFSLIRKDIKTICIENIPKRIEAGKKALSNINKSTEGMILANLNTTPIPKADYYFIYLPIGKLLDSILKQILHHALTKEITIIVIESHGDLINTLETEHPWIKKVDLKLKTKIPRHDSTIYFFKSLSLNKINHWFNSNNNNFSDCIKQLVRNKIILKDNINSLYLPLLLKKLSSSFDYEIIIKDKDIGSDQFYYWLGSTYNMQLSTNKNQYKLQYPERIISIDQIDSIIIPEDFWWNYRTMRFSNLELPKHGYIRKIIIKPKQIIEFSTGKRIKLYKLVRGFKRLMKKTKIIEKKFEKQKAYNKIHATQGNNELILVLDHLKPDFNIGKIFRTAEAFDIKEIHVVGTTFFDPGPSMGGLKKVKAYFYQTFNESLSRLKKLSYTTFCLDSNTDNHIHEILLPQKCAFILGHEEFGPQFDRNSFPEIKNIKIMQFGTTESLNVSIAASIATYEYIRQHNLTP